MAPLVAALLKVGLPLIASAVQSKGQQAAEKYLGVSIPDLMASPEGQAELKRIEVDEADALQAFITSMIKIDVDDMANARAHAAAIAEKTPNGPGVWRPNIMVAAAWGVAFLVLWLIWRANNLDEFTKATMSLILGRALGWIDQAFQFDFGSTRSSKAKDVAIEQLSRKDRE